jgi:hypothetical protein
MRTILGARDGDHDHWLTFFRDPEEHVLALMMEAEGLAASAREGLGIGHAAAARRRRRLQRQRHEGRASRSRAADLAAVSAAKPKRG